MKPEYQKDPDVILAELIERASDRTHALVLIEYFVNALDKLAEQHCDDDERNTIKCYTDALFSIIDDFE